MKPNDQPAQFVGDAEVRLVRTLPGPIERIWDYLTDAEKRSRWFAGGPMEPRQGGKMTLRFHHKNLAPGETPPEEFKTCHVDGEDMEGTVLRWEPPRVLSYTFGDDSDVTFELTPQGNDVLLVLTHRRRGDTQPPMAGFAAGWHTHFAHLIALLENKPRPPFWPMHFELKAYYEKARAEALQT